MRYFLLLLLPSVAFANGVEIDKPLSTPISVTNGGTGAAPGGGDQVVVSDSTSAATWKTLTDCDAASSAMTYDTTTNAFGCNTITSATTVFPQLSRGYVVTDTAAAGFTASNFPAVTAAVGTGFAANPLMGTVCGEYSTTDPPAAGDYIGISSSVAITSTGSANRPVYAHALIYTQEDTAAADMRVWFIMASNDTAGAWKGYDSNTAKVYAGIRQSDAAGDTSMMCCTADAAAQSCTSMNYLYSTTSGGIPIYVTLKWIHGTSVVCNAYNPYTGALLGTATHATNVSPAVTNLIVGSTVTATSTDDKVGWRGCFVGITTAPGTSAFN